MAKTHSSLTDSTSTIRTADLSSHVRAWLMDAQIGQLSNRTIDSRQRLLGKLIYFLEQKNFEECGQLELREFIAYVKEPHAGPNGRKRLPSKDKPNREGTVLTYWAILRTFFRFLISEEVLEVSPMEKVRKPIARADQIQPFTEQQIEALIGVAKKSRHPRWDEALLLFLLDTGVRASEICTLRKKDLDQSGRRCTVHGKGNERRDVFFGPATAKALWRYLQEEPRDDGSPIFMSDRGLDAGEALTKSGLFQLIRRLGRAAKLESVRCSPHTLRHTFALWFLQNGGNVFGLQIMLGHTSLQMSRRYAALADADIEKQHQQYSPVSRLKGKGLR